MKKHVILLLVATLLSYGCCTKKGCPDWELPVLTIHFTGAATDDVVTLFRLKNNVVQDSSKQSASIDLELRPFTEHDVNTASGLSFIISRNGKKDNLSGFTATFETEEIVCNKCFPFGRDMETVRKYSNFSYLHNSTGSSETRLDLPM